MQISELTRGIKPLNEELERIGVPLGEALHLAGINQGVNPYTNALMEEAGAAAVKPAGENVHVEADPFDGDDVTEALLTRCYELPFDRLSEEDIDEVIAELKEKTLPEDASDELTALAESTAKKLIQEKFFKTVSAKGKIIKKKVLTGAAKLKGRLSRLKTRAKRAIGRKKYKISSGFKKLARFAGRLSVRKKKKRVHGESVDLVNELHGLLESEGIDVTPSLQASVMDRLGRIFLMLGEEFGDESVDNVMAECLESLCTLQESGEELTEDDFMKSVRPSLRVVKRLIEELDERDSDDLTEDEIEEIVATVPDEHLQEISFMESDEVDAWIQENLGND